MTVPTKTLVTRLTDFISSIKSYDKKKSSTEIKTIEASKLAIIAEEPEWSSSHKLRKPDAYNTFYSD